jgi:uncharacterized iron-regulated membrane protein
MSVTEFVISFIFMAVATMTILVVGTLGAADLLHRSRRGKEAKERSDSHHLEHQPDDARSRPDFQSEAAAVPDAEMIDALMPLGSSLNFVADPKRRAAADPQGDPEEPPHGRAA